MTFELAIKRSLAKGIVLLTTLALAGLLGVTALSSFIIGALTDERRSMPIELLTAAADYFPTSARLNARLAQTELRQRDRDLLLAESFARRAVSLSPFDHSYRLLLADVEEAGGNRDSAENSLRNAISLAPTSIQVQWRLANLLLRQHKIEESLNEFHNCTSADNSLLPAALDLVWRVSGGNIDQVKAVTGEGARARIILAQFFIKQSLVSEAANVFVNVDRTRRRESAEASTFINLLIDAGQLAAARELWLDTVAGRDAFPAEKSNLTWDGSFEADTPKSFSQFAWNIRPSDYAQVRISTESSRSGGRALRIDFAGRDTTRLEGTLGQLVVTRPGQRYRIECYTKREQLVTPAGPTLAVLEARSSRLIAASSTIAAGSSGWEQLSCEFIAPENSEGVRLEIRRIPRFSYDDPTRGTIWFDDFVLIELNGNNRNDYK